MSGDLLLLSRRQALRHLSLQSAAVWAALAQTHRPEQLQFFSAEQAAEVEAMAAQIIPSDETPGAKEAGVIYFIDLDLAKFEPESRTTYLEGLKDLSKRVVTRDSNSSRFATLNPQAQIEILQEMEKTDFFNLVRTHTIMGFLSNPQYLGNRDKAGWKLIGFEDAHAWQPPFGEYDAAATKEKS